MHLGSDVTVLVEAGPLAPANCLLTGGGLTQATRNTWSEFDIFVSDQFGNPRANASSQVTVEVEAAATNERRREDPLIEVGRFHLLKQSVHFYCFAKTLTVLFTNHMMELLTPQVKMENGVDAGHVTVQYLVSQPGNFILLIRSSGVHLEGSPQSIAIKAVCLPVRGSAWFYHFSEIMA